MAANDSFDEDELEEYLRKKDEEALKKQGRAVPASKSSVSFAGGGPKMGSIEETRAQIQQKATALESQHQQGGGGRGGGSSTRPKSAIPPVARSTAANWGQARPAEAEARSEPKALADARKLPEAQRAAGGRGTSKTALVAAAPKAVPRGGPAPARSSSRVPFMDDYEREEDLLLAPGSKDEVGLYIDPDFPADASSLFIDPRNPPRWHPPAAAVKWLRPDQLVKTGVPVIFSDEHEILQGALGDSWLLGALGCVSTRRDLLDVIIASAHNRLKGIYTLRFYKRGQWKNVVIDDRIPCDESDVPLYARSRDPQQIWVMLVEKAYAKLHGCYEALANGTMTYALRDLTAGAAQTISLKDETVQDQISNGFLWQQVKLWSQQGLLGGAQDDHKDDTPMPYNAGLRRRRLYSILEAQEPVAGKRFLKMRQNLGKERAWQTDRPAWRWTGQWAAGASEWQSNADIRTALDPSSRALDRGQFWIAFEDWAKYFDVLYVCQVFPASWMTPMSTDPEPEPLVMHGTWRKANSTCGGSPKKGNAYWWKNPQFILSLASGERTQVFVTVSQEDPRYNPNGSASNGKAPFKKPTKSVDQYGVAIGVAVVRKRVLENKKKGSQLQRADVELISRPFRKNRDVSVTTPKILDPRSTRDEFVIIPMVYDAASVVGELNFWITVAASKHVRLDPLDPNNLVQPLGAQRDDDDSEEESDNDYEEAQLIEPTYPENAHGGFVIKGLSKERRSTRQIIAACAKTNSKYEDPDFPPDSQMLNLRPLKGLYKMQDIAFLRPCWRGQPDKQEHLNAANPPADPPVLVLDSGSIGSMKQGQLSDSWLLGAAASVATKGELLQQLLVDFSLEWGVFTFRIFKQGKWQHVTIDDRLPAKKETRRCLFAIGVDTENEAGHQGARGERVMWISLFEKAYAKLYGCYQNLNHGCVAYGLKDVTAGAPQTIYLNDDATRTKLVNGTLWKQLVDWSKSGCVLTLSFTGGDSEAAQSLRKGRCYPILELKAVEEGDETYHMIRLKNAWANEAPYSGLWANESANWSKFKNVAAACRHEDSNSFWMKADGKSGSFESGELYLTFQTGALVVDRIFPASWQRSRSRARWTSDNSMGPPFQSDDPNGEWLLNPQFELHVQETRTLIFITVGQLDKRAQGQATCVDPVGFCVVPLHRVREKGSSLTRLDMVNPEPVPYRRARDADLSYAMTLDAKDSPFLIVCFTQKLATGPLYCVVWHNKPVMMRGGVCSWSSTWPARDPEDMEDGLFIQDDTPHDPDPQDDLLAAKGRSSYIATAALAQDDSGGGRGNAGGAGQIDNQSARLEAQVAELEGKVKQTVVSKEKVPDEGRSGGTAGGGMSGDRPELCKQIMKKLNDAEVWQLKAILAILKNA